MPAAHLESERLDGETSGEVGLLRVHEGVPRGNSVHQEVQLFA